ncbi:MAG: hypothetical protein C5B53_12870 [Candidatus Melainabacteria bacterium]|nr:MAG: hypothetical protein C5B53_12870 [Candidatus Melainabacteria bacterium]
MVTVKPLAKNMFGRFSLVVPVVLASLSSIDVEAASPAKSYEPKPQLNKQVKPGEVTERTVPEPGQPESNQPPPDVVGKVPKDLKKAARKKETEKLVPVKHRQP